MTVLYKLKSLSHTAAFQPISSGGNKPHYSKDERVASKCLLLFGVAMQHIKKIDRFVIWQHAKLSFWKNVVTTFLLPSPTVLNVINHFGRYI